METESSKSLKNKINFGGCLSTHHYAPFNFNSNKKFNGFNFDCLVENRQNTV